MRFIALSVFIAAGVVAVSCSSARSVTEPGPSLNWGPAPAVFPVGAQMAVLSGNPAASSEFTIRLKMPDGYRIPPHTHPTDENVTVISGTFKVGMGPVFATDSLATLNVGGFVTAPAGHQHFAVAQGPTIVQVHALGPFALTYVNPNDTPRAAAVRR
ncbi:MAG TPA: cupin domain-containing protein [Gemmatimonadaceae bacterium]|jgi:quercetin dioxygenase-like cupin family protein